MSQRRRRSRIAPALELAVLGALAAAASGADLSLTAVRCFSAGEITRVAIETSGDFRFRFDKLSNPDRIFFDILGAQVRLSGKQTRGIRIVRVRSPLVKQLRIAQTEPDVARVVFDLTGPVEHSTSQLSNPSRLIVELRAAEPVSPLARPSLASAPATRTSYTPLERAKRVESKATVVGGLEPEEVKPVVRTARAVAGDSILRTPVVEPVPLPPLLESGPDVPKVETTVLESRTPVLEPKRAPVAAKIAEVPAPSTAPAEIALPARRNSKGESSLTRVLGLKLERVVLDAGHGGHDVGTIGPKGLMEKDIVLDVAKRLGELIESRLGSEVIYTRSGDTFIPLEQRTEMANSHRADLFLSIHANSSPYKAAAGSETFYLNFTNSAPDLEVAARENAGHGKSIYELKELIQKIALKDKLEESREFAAKVQASLFPVSVRGNSKAKNRGVKTAPFVVLIGASMPSVLAEIGFISNPREEAQLKLPEHRQRIAEALYRGIAKYASTLSRYSVAQRTSTAKAP